MSKYVVVLFVVAKIPDFLVRPLSNIFLLENPCSLAYRLIKVQLQYLRLRVMSHTFVRHLICYFKGYRHQRS